MKTIVFVGDGRKSILVERFFFAQQAEFFLAFLIVRDFC